MVAAIKEVMKVIVERRTQYVWYYLVEVSNIAASSMECPNITTISKKLGVSSSATKCELDVLRSPPTAIEIDKIAR